MMAFPGFLGPIGWQELLLILAVVLLIFGPRRLPEIADAMGKSIRKFKHATRDAGDEVRREIDEIKRSPESGRPGGDAARGPGRPAEPGAADRDRP